MDRSAEFSEMKFSNKISPDYTMTTGKCSSVRNVVQ